MWCLDEAMWGGGWTATILRHERAAGLGLSSWGNSRGPVSGCSGPQSAVEAGPEGHPGTAHPCSPRGNLTLQSRGQREMEGVKESKKGEKEGGREE